MMRCYVKFEVTNIDVPSYKSVPSPAQTRLGTFVWDVEGAPSSATRQS